MSAVLTDAWGVAPDPPAELVTPWATTLTRTEGGLYVEAESGRERSYWSWGDAFARHFEGGRPRWSRSPGGVRYLVAGERFVLLWPGWSAGVMQTAGRARGRWLLPEVAFDVARRAAEDWWIAEQGKLAAAVDVDALLSPVA